MHSLSAEEVLARVILAEKGTPGRDVRGNAIPAKDGEPSPVTAGENVVVSEDGLEFRAKIPGMVVFENDVITVTDVFEIRGDVDFSTGNIDMAQGSVKVSGTIRSGFTVTAAKDITVGEAVESAVVKAGGDIEVRRGIVMDEKGEKGELEAGGNVRAHFAKNARIKAGGDIIIDNDITHCELLAQGQVLATKGKGRIQGGTVRCGGGVEVNMIGSEMAVVTKIIVGLEDEGHQRVLAEQKQLEEMAAKIDKILGTDDARTIIMRAPEAKRQAVGQLLKTRIGARDRLREIDVIVEAEQERLRRSAAARILVKRTAYPGTVVTIAGCVLKLKQAVNASYLYYDPESHSIASKPSS